MTNSPNSSQVESSKAGFTQQGSIDWVQLAAHTVSFSLDVLSRYSAAGVDSYTLQVGQAICSQLEPSAAGRNNVLNALAKLPSYGSYGNILWFGFGTRHVVRSLPKTTQGLTCLALCGTLSEFYHKDLSAEILNNLVQALDAPPELTPSVLQWQSLVQACACAGTFTTSGFGVLVEKLMQLNPHAWYQQDHEFCGTTATRRSCASPSSMAEALRGLGEVTRKSISAITIIGGSDAAWLAAISEWLLDLRVVIRSPDGTELYDTSGNLDPQVVIIYEEQRGEQSPETTSRIRCVGKTYILEDATKLFALRPSGHYIAATCGRASWDTLLTTIFGSDFQFLMNNHPQSVGSAMGSVARLLLGVVNAEPGVPGTLLSSWSHYCPDSYGRGFITSLIQWFPELTPLRQGMERASNVTFAEARTTYENRLGMIQLICDCGICNPNKRQQNSGKFCYVVMVETILALGLRFSEMIIDPDLFVKRTGIENFYGYQVQKRRFPPGRSDIPGVLSDIRGYLFEELGPFAFIFRDSGTATDNTLLDCCLELFTGFRNDENGRTSGLGSGRSAAGICAYLQILNDLSDTPDITGKICVIPGVIEHLGRPYNKIVDDRRPVPRTTPSYDELSLYNQVQIGVTETATDLEIWFELSRNDNLPEAEGSSALKKIPLKTFKFGPLRFVQGLQKAQGWTNCTQYDCPVVVKDIIQERSEPFHTNVLGTDVCLFRGGTIPRCGAIALATIYSRVCLLKDKACLQCTLKTVVSGPIEASYFSVWGKANPSLLSTARLLVCGLHD